MVAQQWVWCPVGDICDGSDFGVEEARSVGRRHRQDAATTTASQHALSRVRSGPTRVVRDEEEEWLPAKFALSLYKLGALEPLHREAVKIPC